MAINTMTLQLVGVPVSDQSTIELVAVDQYGRKYELTLKDGRIVATVGVPPDPGAGHPPDTSIVTPPDSGIT